MESYLYFWELNREMFIPRLDSTEETLIIGKSENIAVFIGMHVNLSKLNIIYVLCKLLGLLTNEFFYFTGHHECYSRHCAFVFFPSKCHWRFRAG